MSKKEEKRQKWIFRIFLVLSFIWIGVIFFFSAQPAAESAELSTETTDYLLSSFSKFSLLWYLKEKGILEFAVRKLAHMAEYGILAVFLGITIRSGKRWNAKWQWKTGILCFLYACSDEFHQLFVAGRSGQIRDVVIDTVGASGTILLLSLFLWQIERRKKYRSFP